MDLTEIVKMVAKMSGMNKREREQLEKIVEQLEEMDEINNISDLNDLNIDLQDFNLDDLDFDEFDFDIDPGMGERPGKRSVDDFRKKKDESNESIDVTVSEDDLSDEPFHGSDWVNSMNKEDAFETFVDIPDEVRESNADVNVRMDDESVYVSEPIGEEISLDELPRDVYSFSVEQRGSRLLILVE